MNEPLVIVDTSVWIDHFRTTSVGLEDLVTADRLLMHPFVVGELAMVSLPNPRADALRELGRLPEPQVASRAEVLAMVEGKSLHGRGIGYVDAHLLASTLADSHLLWSTDQRLRAAAQQLGVAYAA